MEEPMKPNTKRIAVAVLVYAAATIASVAAFGGGGVGLFIDGALLVGLFYYLAVLGKKT